MTSFRDLLKVDPALTPGEEQRRASQGLVHAVARSHLRWWKGSEIVSHQGQFLLLAVAPFSQYDMTLLDRLDEGLVTHQPPVSVYVANLQDYASVEQLSVDFPGIGQAQPTPIAALCEHGSPKMVVWGKKARDLAAQVLGMAPEELSQRIVAESPRYASSTGQSTRATP
jgi:hypothetical protein